MTLLPLLLVAVIALADAGLGWPVQPRPLGAWDAVIVAVVLPALVVLVVAVRVRRLVRSAVGGGGIEPIIAAGRWVGAGRWTVVALFAAAVLMLGWLDVVRGVVGDLVLVDEVICLLPPILAVLGLWWAHHPAEAQVRTALLVRQLDRGGPIYPVPTAGAYVLAQARSGLLLLLIPVLLIIGSAEAIEIVGRRWLDPPAPEAAIIAAGAVAAFVVFALSPLIALAVLSVERLEAGDVRDDLEAVCRRHRVRVRDILLWRTGGALINAAVMGLVGPLRFVLMTDALLDHMSRPEVEAVMAHEVAHVRRRHMPWLVVCLIAALAAVSAVIDGITVGVARWIDPAALGAWPSWLELVVAAGSMAAALVAFGWVSRRFERQADTFAVQHLSPGDAVDAGAVEAMQSALGRIALLNAVDPHRRSWRHGSIAWRQSYLQSLIGRAADRLPIDGLVRRIKLAAAAVLVLAIGAEVGLHVLVNGTAPAPDASAPVVVRAAPAPDGSA